MDDSNEYGRPLPGIACIAAIFASLCIAIFSMLSCYYAKMEYDNSRMMAEKVQEKYASGGNRPAAVEGGDYGNGQ